MSATATIELINGEQLATRTDLLLVRARAARGRLSSNKHAFANDVRFARGSHATLPTIPAPEPAPELDPERTIYIRVRRAGTSTASAVILATLFAIAIVITSLP